MIIDHIRDKKEFYNLYHVRPMPNQYDFDFLVNNPNLFCFYDEVTNKLKGFITIQKENGVLTLSGTSVRKNMADIILAIKFVCNIFDEDIFAFTPLKHAGLVLLKSGFKKVGKNIYVRKKI